MVNCTFCGNTLRKGIGKIFVKKDGKILYFCSTKCEKSLLKLHRKPRLTPWTKEFKKIKEEEKEKRKKEKEEPKEKKEAKKIEQKKKKK